MPLLGLLLPRLVRVDGCLGHFSLKSNIRFPGRHFPWTSCPPFLWIRRHRHLNIRRHCRYCEAPLDPQEVLGLGPQLECRWTGKCTELLFKE